MKDIKFFWNGSFAGINYSMVVNDKEIGLGYFCPEDEAKLKAIEILKDDYNLDYDFNNINFIWGGCL
jgi:hypothetical protein